MKRRTFLVATGSASLVLGRAPALLGLGPRPDLVIRGGGIIDGTGATAWEGDLAVTAGRITALGRRVATAGREEIDARGLAVAPGFIDIHSHGDSNLPADPRGESLIRQGLTTIVVGADGDSDATGAPGDTFAAYWNKVQGWGPAVNVASMVGLGAIRGRLIGEMDRPATPAEVATMRDWVAAALVDGACGASTGLEYTPGAFASTDELAAVASPLARHRLPYATHMRNEDDRLLEAIDEAIAVARGAGCPLEISHLKAQYPRNWDKQALAFDRIAAARTAGIDVTFDRYPYIAYQTGLTNLFPAWSRDGGMAGFFGRLADSAVAPQLRAAALAKVEGLGGWDNVMITGVRDSSDRSAEGKRLGSYARSLGADPYETTVALLRRSQGEVGMVGFGMSEEGLDRIYAHPQSMVCSDGGSYAVDGPTHRGAPHPRGFGSFPRVLGRYVRERKALSLEQAVHKMSGQPASRLRIRDRGRLAKGLAADVTVFDPATVADRATFEDPWQYPVGIPAVIVNGTIALRDGERLDADRHAGAPVRPSR